MKSKMTTNSQLLTPEPKKNKTKNKLSKQLKQEQNHKWRSHGGISGREKNGGNGTGNKKHKLVGTK